MRALAATGPEGEHPRALRTAADRYHPVTKLDVGPRGAFRAPGLAQGWA